MKQIIALTDYKDHFGSKFNAIPYNSGMDKTLLSKCFEKYQINLTYICLSEVINYETHFWKDKLIIYTSSEDEGYLYKSFIEDIVCYLELIEVRVIPAYKYLRAHNNKVFMELLRNSFNNKELQTISSKVFGSLEEVKKCIESFKYPLVFKQSAGAMSKGVGIAYNEKELIRSIKQITRNKQYFKEYWEKGRRLKYAGYVQQSKYRNKFILQNFVDELRGDYKVLVFGEKYYVLKRDTKNGDFRASGSGIRNFVKNIPEGILTYAHLCMQTLNVPHVSLDIGYNGKSFFLIEFQCLYFGSYTLTFSNFYWKKNENIGFEFIEGKSVLEEEYVKSIVEFITDGREQKN
ncbi:MAG: hypothetical protein V4608_01445 [Bacteroidota bacterium]